MPEPPTPGQCAYAAYLAALAPRTPWDAHPWPELPTVTQHAWEAAAEAAMALVLPTPERPAVTAAVVAGQAVLAQAQEGTLTLDLDPDVQREDDPHAP